MLNLENMVLHSLCHVQNSGPTWLGLRSTEMRAIPEPGGMGSAGT